MKHLKLYEHFLNEDGYGRDFFFKQKQGKVSKYFFKIDGEEEQLGFVLEIGKLSRNISIEDAENSYAVLTIEPISVSVMDDYLVKESDYKSREEETFELTESELMRTYKIVGEAIKDYLENNPKVSQIYDEMGLNIDIDFEEYLEKVKSLMSFWSFDRWSLQEASAKRTLLYTRRDHD
jgi:hypothetical protein